MSNRIFIVGVMKGGTTALYQNLCVHEQITGGSIKELHYYSMNYHCGQEWYENQFPQNEESLYTIDASPTYFSESQNGTQIASLIKKDFPKAKIIIITRDPIERAVSHFNHLKKTNKKQALADIDVNEFFAQDFLKAIAPCEPKEWFLSRVLGNSNYLWPYLLYKGQFAKDQIKVITNEDFKRDPQNLMNDLFSFLEIDPIEDELFGKIRYSLSSTINELNEENFIKLRDCLYPSYKLFLKQNNIAFKPIELNPSV